MSAPFPVLGFEAGKQKLYAWQVPVMGWDSANGVWVPLAAGVSGTLNSGPTQLSGVPSSFAVQTADQTVFTLAAGEIGYIQNLDDAALAVKYGAVATNTSFSFILRAGSAADDGNGPIVVIDDWIGAVSVAAMSGTARYIAWKH